MQEKARIFKVWLFPNNERHAECIRKLDEVRDRMENGSARRGDLSAEITNAPYDYFCRDSVKSTTAPVPIAVMPAVRYP